MNTTRHSNTSKQAKKTTTKTRMSKAKGMLVRKKGELVTRVYHHWPDSLLNSDEEEEGEMEVEEEKSTPAKVEAKGMKNIIPTKPPPKTPTATTTPKTAWWKEKGGKNPSPWMKNLKQVVGAPIDKPGSSGDKKRPPTNMPKPPPRKKATTEEKEWEWFPTGKKVKQFHHTTILDTDTDDEEEEEKEEEDGYEDDDEEVADTATS